MSYIRDGIDDGDIREQLDLLCSPRGIPERQGRLLRHLIKAQNEEKFLHQDGTAVLNEFERQDKRKGRTSTRRSADPDKAATRARQLASQLKRSLVRYYANLPSNPTDRLRIVLGKGHEPEITALAVQSTTEDARVSFLGSNIDALDYVADRIEKLSRIEETFVRWVHRNSTLYSRSTFRKFLTALSQSKLLYRAVLGPMTDAIVYEEGGLRSILLDRNRNHAFSRQSARIYRLWHGTAMMNFTLLYFADSKHDFYHRTSNVEVLFGYGLNKAHERADETVVFRTKDQRIVKEFQDLFEALRSDEFSRELHLDRAGLFLNEPRQCEVLATFSCLPKEEIVRKIKACGLTMMPSIGAVSVDQPPRDQNDNYVEGRPHIKICVSALRLLEDEVFLEPLRMALGRGVQVSIALWEPGGPFLVARTKASKLKADTVKREVEGARSAVQSLGSHPNLFARECFGEWASASIIWIDEVIFYSSYWIGRNVAEGPHFMVASTSETGRVLVDQYAQMIAESRPV